MHSTAATIHPLDAETQWARGGRTGRVAEIDRSSSSMSSGGSQIIVACCDCCVDKNSTITEEINYQMM